MAKLDQQYFYAECSFKVTEADGNGLAHHASWLTDQTNQITLLIYLTQPAIIKFLFTSIKPRTKITALKNTTVVNGVTYSGLKKVF